MANTGKSLSNFKSLCSKEDDYLNKTLGKGLIKKNIKSSGISHQKF